MAKPKNHNGKSKIDIMMDFVRQHPEGDYETYLEWSGESPKTTKRPNFFERRSRARRMLNLVSTGKKRSIETNTGVTTNSNHTEVSKSTKKPSGIQIVMLDCSMVTKHSDDFKQEFETLVRKYSGENYEMNLESKDITAS